MLRGLNMLTVNKGLIMIFNEEHRPWEAIEREILEMEETISKMQIFVYETKNQFYKDFINKIGTTLCRYSDFRISETVEVSNKSESRYFKIYNIANNDVRNIRLSNHTLPKRYMITYDVDLRITQSINDCVNLIKESFNCEIKKENLFNSELKE